MNEEYNERKDETMLPFPICLEKIHIESIDNIITLGIYTYVSMIITYEKIKKPLGLNEAIYLISKKFKLEHSCVINQLNKLHELELIEFNTTIGR